MNKLSSRQEGLLSIIAALIVLFSAMLNPMVSVVIAITVLVIYSIYRFTN